MADLKIDIVGAKIPKSDGEINEYAYKEAIASTQFNLTRKVIFINGMLNSGANHVESAMALSWVQMCTVIGVYNASTSGLRDFAQCIGDKAQFSVPAKIQVAVGMALGSQTPVEVARSLLSRNRAQEKLFDLLRKPENRRWEIFAHSQGNLILSNALQAIAAVDGPQALVGRTIHTFGSPVQNWPAHITKYEHGFTFDFVTLGAGFDSTWSISKVGMPIGSMNPITHGFLEYVKCDPAFVVNRFRLGSIGVTFNMDEDGLAKTLAAMGTNMRRVLAIFEHLNKKHNSDADDVAVRYLDQIKKSPATIAALTANRPLVALLVRILDEGYTGSKEKKAIAFLQAL